MSSEEARAKRKAEGTACEALRLTMHLPLGRQVLAFGDGENDLEMLQMAGTGVAMDNAKDIVKSVANCVTLSNDESGVAHGIQTHILDQLAPAR